ncbi:iron-containing alcohol dehydrogenase [Enterocloster bolteae]|uniref:iron-containing alcohol dehydrogenase n=1 Tax=Enterocloster bolteae TaxID=208479 RepID=UPI002A83774D|nr:iron-containing alcohol dehydrogenase [Enterocloster bolteae]
MSEFTLEMPTKIYFGNNITEKAIGKQARWIHDVVMLVTTGRTLKKLGYVDALVQLLEGMPNVKEVLVFEHISSNPRLSEVKEAVRIGKTKSVNCIVGFGGGSALDAAKAAAVGIGSDQSLESFLLEEKVPGRETLPIIAIPTTAGTGSELSKGAILSSPEHHIKTGIRGEHIYPKAAIVDPVYTWSVPQRITMETGFDVLSHGIESFLAVKSNPFTEMLSEKVIHIVAKQLPALYGDLDNKAAREVMSYASMLMGINLANAGTCLPHRIQYAIGAATDTSHGAGLAALYPSWIMHEYEVNPEKVSYGLFVLTNKRVSGKKEAGICMRDFLERLDLGYTLGSLGIRADELSVLAEAVTGNIGNDLLSHYKGCIAEILAESLQ